MKATSQFFPSFLFCLVLLLVSNCTGCKKPVNAPTLPPKVKTHLDRAHEESNAVIEKSLRDIHDFFDEAKKGSRPFAETALDTWSKIRLGVDYLPFTRNNRNENYLKRAFGNNIFTSDQLAKVIEQSVIDYIRRIEQIENNMLTKMKEDLPDLPETCPFNTLETAQVINAFRARVESIMASSQTAVGEQVLVHVVAETSSTIAGAVVARLGLSTILIGTGASISWADAGIGVVAAVIVDYIIHWIWDWYADPKGELAKMVEEKLDEIRDVVIVETRQQLQNYSNTRNQARKAAISELLTSTP